MRESPIIALTVSMATPLVTVVAEMRGLLEVAVSLLLSLVKTTMID